MARPARWRAYGGAIFSDSTLNQYVDQALRYNSDVLIARERVNEYQARAYAADSSLFPSLDASPTGTCPRLDAVPPPPACRSTAHCIRAA
ncbi:hypothetical protein LN650_17870 [Klebsiella pneumoniae subsp. pneumoniae]|nr:hypothetical protein [Klebsiella pneumoniae subsp. pneumoniae]